MSTRSTTVGRFFETVIFAALSAAAATASAVSAERASAPETGGAARYRTAAVDRRVQSVPPAIQNGVFADPERYVDPLVRSLTEGISDEFLKVKVLHDWLAVNIAYDVDSFLAGTRVDSSWAATLRRRKAVCQGYAELMVKMCESAAVRCRKIDGYARGYGYLSAQVDSPGAANHAWNAVYLQGAWRLVDVTWDAGQVEQRSFRKEYGTAYLFLEPEFFLYTHLPSEAKWQLLDPPRTAEQFSALPYLPGRFFERGLRLITPLGRVNRAGESVQFALQAPDDVIVTAGLKSPGGTDLPRRALVRREASQCKVLAVFPKAGRWKVWLYAKPRGTTGNFAFAASLEFESTAGTDSIFPVTYTAYDDMFGSLHSPVFVPLPAEKPLVFQLRVRGAEEVYLVVGDKKWEKLAPHAAEEGLYQLTAPVPRGLSAKLVARVPGADRKYTTLVDYAAGKQ